MRVNLPLLYDQLRAGIRNDGWRNPPRQTPETFWLKGFSEGGEINEAKNNRRNFNFLRFGSLLAGTRPIRTSRRPRLPNPMSGRIYPMSWLSWQVYQSSPQPKNMQRRISQLFRELRQLITRPLENAAAAHIALWFAFTMTLATWSRRTSTRASSKSGSVSPSWALDTCSR